MTSTTEPDAGGRKVFVVGLSKTGTSTMKVMLGRLGYNVCGPRKHLLKAWRDGNFSAVDDTLEAFDAFEDWPWPLVYRTASERYGDRARFILTHRSSADAWFRSIESHGYGTRALRSMKDAYGHYRPFGRKQAFVQQYNDHNDAVRAYFAGQPHRFTDFCLENGDGWQKLCAFLDHPVPEDDVPHRNRSVPGRKRLNRAYNTLIAPIYRRWPHG